MLTLIFNIARTHKLYAILRSNHVLLEPKDVEKSGKITRLDKIYKDSSAMTKNRELPERSLSPIIAIV